jgi:chromosomal replication initiation ATPase DnaA
MFREFNPASVLDKAAKILNCDIRRFRRSSRISSPDKADRDILVYALWKTGMLTNEKIGELFGVTSSSISHSVRAINLKLQKDRQARDKLNQIYSLFNGLLPKSF